jgi:hypothetical protein
VGCGQREGSVEAGAKEAQVIWAVGDIVQRSDIKGRKKYVVTHLATDGSGWVYARELGGNG